MDIRLNINGKEVVGKQGQTILQVARENGIFIPTLCYEEKLKSYGSCGLCIVEVDGNPKLPRSCATEIAEGMVVRTDTKRLNDARKLSLELILSDHLGDCRPPCMKACPAETDCQGYVGLIANGQYKEALKLIKEKFPFPASIGRVCPHPCEKECRRQMVEEPISIAALKRFLGDTDLQGDTYMPERKPLTGKTVAVVGGGPSGLTAAYFLAKEGHSVVVYEAMPEAGGMLRYGIPEYRLPNDILDQEIELIESVGVEILTNVKIGKDVTLDFLKDNFDAVYIAIGAWKSSPLGVKGEDLTGVMGGIDFLRKVTLNQPLYLGEKVAIVGGGNTAMDACRTAVRMGAKEVTLLYRRTRNEMPAEEIEIREAEEEGVQFKFLSLPLEVMGENGKVTKMKVQKMELGEPDASGRRKPVPIEGAEEIMEVDTVIAAIGQQVVPVGLEQLELTKKNTISTDETTYRTSVENVFAGGDAINKGPGIAIAAIGHGKKAADAIMKYLNGETVEYKAPFLVEKTYLTEKDFEDREKKDRVPVTYIAPEIRKQSFMEVAKTYTEEEAVKEASRCLECGCKDYFECKLIQLANQYDVKPSRIRANELHERFALNGHPYIERDPNKCILCGLCVRTCAERVEIGALGLVNRGFQAIVQPAFGMELTETNCISCGLCVANCPTGALQEKLTITKSVPLKTAETDSICSYCSMGCHVKYETKGNMLVKSLNNEGSNVDNGFICVRGRFGIHPPVKSAPVTEPLMKKDGKLVPVSYEEAYATFGKDIRRISGQYGEQAFAMAVSDKLTNETIFTAKRFGEELLHTDRIGSFNGFDHGLKDVFGYDASPNTLEEIYSTEVLLVVGLNDFWTNPTAWFKVKEAKKRGVKVIFANQTGTAPLKIKGDLVIKTDDTTAFLQQMIKGVIEIGAKVDDNAVGFDELKASLEGITVSEEAEKAASLYGKAKKAMILFSQNELSCAGAQLIADLAVVSGHIGKPRQGIVELKPKNNSQGLVDMGIQYGRNALKEQIEQGKVKGLIVVGEDASCDMSQVEYLVVMDSFLTDTAKQADLVLPLTGFGEEEGTYTSTERRIQKVNNPLYPASGCSNLDVLMDMAAALDADFDYASIEEVQFDMDKKIPCYQGIRLGKEGIWPLSETSNILYGGGNYANEDGKAHLAAAEKGAPLYRATDKLLTTDYLQNTLNQFLKEQHIIK